MGLEDQLIVAGGLRQPWRMGLDPTTGDLWIGDVGENTQEEINRLSKDQLATGSVNLGWPFREGSGPGPVSARAPGELVEPIWSRDRLGQPSANVVAGLVYRGSQIGWLNGEYVFSDFATQDLMVLDPTAPSAGTRTIGRLSEHPVAFAVGPDGELWWLSAEGGVFRLEDAAEQERLNERFVARLPGSSPGGEESTALAVEPTGDGVLVSDRTGRVFRIGLRPAPTEVCALSDLRLSPQLAYDPPTEQQALLDERISALDAAIPLLPEPLLDDVLRLSAFHDEVLRLAAEDEWTSDDVQQLLRTTSIERGEFAEVLRSENALVNFTNNRCPRSPAPSGPTE